MRAIGVVLVILAWPAVARTQVVGRPASNHQERAFAAMEAGDHVTAAAEFYEAFWLTRNLNLLRGAAQEAELAGLGHDAATYYYLYINLARLPADEAETLRRKVTQQHWSAEPGRAAAAPVAPTPRPAAPKPVGVAPVAPAAPVPTAPTTATPPGTVVASTAGTTGTAGTTAGKGGDPFVEPFPVDRLRPLPQPATIRPISRAPKPRPGLREDTQVEGRVERVSYAGQILVSEAVSLTLLVGGIEGGVDGLAALGVVGALFGAPIIHAANGKSGGAAFFGTWGLRLLGMLIVGAASESGSGTLAGYILAAGFDALVVAKKDVVRPESDMAFVPMSTTGGRGLTLAWTF